MKKLCFTLLLIGITQSCLAENIFDRGKSFFEDMSNIDNPEKIIDKCTENNDAGSCWRAGNMAKMSYSEASRAGDDSTARWALAYALMFYEHGCDLGGKKSCYDGANLAKEEGVTKDAYELYNKGCDLGHKESCDERARLKLKVLASKLVEVLEKKE